MQPPMHVSVSTTLGKLSEQVYRPGLHFFLPWPITLVEDIKTELDVDEVVSAECGALDGTTLSFPSIEIGNKIDPVSVVFDSLLAVMLTRGDLFSFLF